MDDMEDLDYLVLNEHEASLFAGVKGLDDSLAKLAKVSPKARILVTLGSRGAAFYLAGKLSKIPIVSLEKLGRKVVNTTGSGDDVVGAFSAYKLLASHTATAFPYPDSPRPPHTSHSPPRPLPPP